MRKSFYSRREFVGMGAVAAGASLAAKAMPLDPDPLWASAGPVPASDRLRLGIIGVGMQGSSLLANAIQLPGVECMAACDVYDGRHTLAQEIVKPNLAVTRRYQELLDNKEIDCLIAAVPDHWHKQIVVDAVQAGKDIYCEKPMSHSASDGVEMVAAAQKTGRIVQIGSQRVSSLICKKAKEMVAQGVIGDLMLVEGWLGRNDPNGAWEYPLPPDLSPQTLDWDTWQGTVPKRPFDPLIFARWRCWKEYGTGVAGDLLVHLVSGMSTYWASTQPPRRVAMAMGGASCGGRMAATCRTCRQHVFKYGEIPVYMRLIGSRESRTYRFQGSKGILEVTEYGLSYSPQAGEDTAPSYYASGFPGAVEGRIFQEMACGERCETGQEPMPQTIVYQGPGMRM